jgi:SpoVK/Ycf46/Vps4 family AAA+-type ATPase
MLEGLITKFMGETAAKLRLVFEAIRQTQGVYLFDEFDALGAHRSQANDVGEIRRVLNSFLQLLEKDSSQSLIVAATNHPEMLDRALFRRFDDVIEYNLPDTKLAEEILRRKLAMFQTADIDWPRVLPETEGLSQAELVRASEGAAKKAVLGGSTPHHLGRPDRCGSRAKGSLPLNAGTASQSPAPLFAGKRASGADTTKVAGAQ